MLWTDSLWFHFMSSLLSSSPVHRPQVSSSLLLLTLSVHVVFVRLFTSWTLWMWLRKAAAAARLSLTADWRQADVCETVSESVIHKLTRDRKRFGKLLTAGVAGPTLQRGIRWTWIRAGLNIFVFTHTHTKRKHLSLRVLIAYYPVTVKTDRRYKSNTS